MSVASKLLVRCQAVQDPGRHRSIDRRRSTSARSCPDGAHPIRSLRADVPPAGTTPRRVEPTS